MAKVSNIKIDKMKRDELVHLSREVNILSQLVHPSIIKFIGYSPTDFSKKRHSVLVTEIYGNGTLSDILDQERRHKTNKIDSTTMMIILYGVASGMSYLHAHKIIHRNLNPESVYLDDHMYPKLGNFELCARNHTLESMTYQSMSGVKGRPSYSAPEILQNNEYSKQGDVYSFGMLVYELVTKKIPFSDKKTVNQMINEVVIKSSRPKIDDSIPECYRDLIENCWLQEARERPTFDEITNILRNDQRFMSDEVDSSKFYIYIKYIDESNIQFHCSSPIVQVDEIIQNKKDSSDAESEGEVEGELPKKYSNIFKKVQFTKTTKSLSVKLKEIDLSVYKKIQNIEKEVFEKVYKVIETATGNIFACKIYDLDTMSDERIKQIERELTVMSKIDHPSIVEFVGYNKENFKKQPRPTIITEFIPNGSLDIILSLERKGHSGIHWNDTQKLKTIYGIASGMSYLHSLNILHCDLKPGNIFIDEFLLPKIGDFGLSETISKNKSTKQKSSMEGTPAYLSPEIIKDHLYSKAGDVYAFGMIVYEIMTSEILYEGLMLVEILLQVSKGIRPKFNGPIPKKYQELIERCWQNDPSERPTFNDIVCMLENDEGFITDTIEEDEYIKYIDTINEIQQKKEKGENISYQNIMKSKFDKIQIDLVLAEE